MGGYYSTHYWWGDCYSAHPPTRTRPSRPPNHLGEARSSVGTRPTRAGPPHGHPQLGTAPPDQLRPALLWGPRGVAGRCVLPSRVRAAGGARPTSARRTGLPARGHPPHSRAATRCAQAGLAQACSDHSSRRRLLCLPSPPRPFLATASALVPRAATLRWPGVGSTRTSSPCTGRKKVVNDTEGWFFPTSGHNLKRRLNLFLNGDKHSINHYQTGRSEAANWLSFDSI